MKCFDGLEVIELSTCTGDGGRCDEFYACNKVESLRMNCTLS